MKKCVAPYMRIGAGSKMALRSLTVHEPRLRQQIAGTIFGVSWLTFRPGGSAVSMSSIEIFSPVMGDGIRPGQAAREHRSG